VINIRFGGGEGPRNLIAQINAVNENLLLPDEKVEMFENPYPPLWTL
jgi:hypothetical protein